MAKHKIQMPDNIYGEPDGGAIDKLTGGGARRPAPLTTAPVTSAAQPQTMAQVQSQHDSVSVKATVTRNVKPTSIYFTPEQLRKLDDLAYTYNGRTGKRINRNDILRHLVDTCDIGDLQGL